MARQFELDVALDSSGVQQGSQQATSALALLSRQAGIVDASIVSLGGTIASVFLAGGAVAGAVSTSNELFDAMLRLETQIGVSSSAVREMGEDVEDLAALTGRSSEDIAGGLFAIQSAGLRGAEAMDTLEQTAKAAAIGLGEQETISRTVVAAMTAYGEENLNSAEATEALLDTVREGNLQASELAGSLGRVIPVAANLGVEFQEVGGAVARLTRLGLSAEQSVTRLTALMSQLVDPSQQAEEAMDQLGITTSDIQRRMRDDGLIDTLQFLNDRVEEADIGIRDLISRRRAVQGFFGIIGQDEGRQAAEIIERMQKGVSDLNEAFLRQQESLSTQLNRTWEIFKNRLRDVGDTIRPWLVERIQELNSVLSGDLAMDPLQELNTGLDQTRSTIQQIDEQLQKLRSVQGLREQFEAMGMAEGISDPGPGSRFSPEEAESIRREISSLLVEIERQDIPNQLQTNIERALSDALEFGLQSDRTAQEITKLLNQVVDQYQTQIQEATREGIQNGAQNIQFPGFEQSLGFPTGAAGLAPGRLAAETLQDTGRIPLQSDLSPLPGQEQAFPSIPTPPPPLRSDLALPSLHELNRKQRIEGRLNEELRTRQQILRRIETDEERRIRMRKRLNNFLAKGVITQDEFTRALKEFGAESKNRLEQFVEDWGLSMDRINQQLSDTLADMLIEWDFTLERMGKSFASSILSQIIQQQAVAPITAGITSGISSAFFGGGGAAPSGPTDPVAITGDTPGPMKFPMGGFMGFAPGDHVIASQTPEGLKKQAGGGSTNVEVRIINNTGAEVQTRERNQGGKKIQEVIIGEVARDFRDGGPAAQAAEQAFGLNRKGTRF